MPRGWEEALAVVAYVYHFPPESLWAMEWNEVRFWTEQAERIGQLVNGR